MIKLYKHNDKVTHLTIKIGKFWISFDKTGIMGWTGKHNFYLLFKPFILKVRALLGDPVANDIVYPIKN